MKKTILLLLIAVFLLSTVSLNAWAEEAGLANQAEDHLHASVQRETDSPEWITALDAAKDESTKQLFVVAGPQRGRCLGCPDLGLRLIPRTA